VLQKRQIEAMNVKKKQLLMHALATRRAKTVEEGASLRRMESELAQIDTALSHDIAILRDRIEGVNREYVEARTRFQAAESECVLLQCCSAAQCPPFDLIVSFFCGHWVV
jgi:hypothetical protein